MSLEESPRNYRAEPNTRPASARLSPANGRSSSVHAEEDARPSQVGRSFRVRQKWTLVQDGEKRTLVHEEKDARPGRKGRSSKPGRRERSLRRDARQVEVDARPLDGFGIFGCPNTISLIWSSWRRARSCGNSPSSTLGLLPSSISTIVVSLSSPFMES
ncbi:hypothetical protein LR48_Vigan03g116900 [Vigna angularis]|uniref:Uncharacterized protein n=1 Tax=Phaseolus angularis TaxID=3914 RepID=A0A0L9U534_PHAAN|nr:hypothetical protein LR48_Vigan03g116900 [Vigna angularis]